jgi:hypothetical protein
MKLNAKYEKAMTKVDNLTFFIFSNYDPTLVYEKKEAKRARKEGRLMTEAEGEAVDEGIMGFIERFNMHRIDTRAYDLFKCQYYDENMVEIIRPSRDPGRYCVMCGRFRRGAPCPHMPQAGGLPPMLVVEGGHLVPRPVQGPQLPVMHWEA